MSYYQPKKSEKLRNAAKIVAGVIGGGGILLFIITLVISGTYGGISFWGFLTAAIPCTVYIFLAWLAYHIINMVCDTYDNTETIMKRVNSIVTQNVSSSIPENPPGANIPAVPLYTPPPETNSTNNEIFEPVATTPHLVVTETDVVVPSDEITNEDFPVGQDDVLPSQEPKPEPAIIYCTQCGFSYDRNGNFCPECGLKNELK